MLLRFGYADGSGEFYITVDAGKCDACGQCVETCPKEVFALLPNPFDPLGEEPVALVREEARNRLKYICLGCQESQKPCVVSCPRGAIDHF